jgi:hypothetical protein
MPYTQTFTLTTYATATFYYLSCCLVILPMYVHSYLNYLLPLHIYSVLVLPVYSDFYMLLLFTMYLFLVSLFECFIQMCIFIFNSPFLEKDLHFTVCLHLLFMKHVTNRIWFDFVWTLSHYRILSYCFVVLSLLLTHPVFHVGTAWNMHQ